MAQIALAPRIRPSRHLTQHWGEYAILALLALMALGPILAILLRSFDVSEQGHSFRFGLEGWSATLSDVDNLRAAGASLFLTIRVPIAMVIAFAIAWAIVRLRVPGHRVFEAGFWFAYFLPSVPMLSGWILLLDGDFGLLNGWASDLGLGRPFDIRTPLGIIWAHLSLQTVPFLVIVLVPAMRLLDRSLEDAALVAGAGPWRVLTRVILPIVAPFMLMAGLASWIRAIEAFEIELILGGLDDYFVIASRIYADVVAETPRMAEAMALSSLFLALLVGLGLVYHWLVQRRGQLAINSGPAEHRQPPPHRRLRRVAAIAVALYLVITVLLPFAMLVCGSFMKLFGFFHLAEVWTTANWSRVLGAGDFRSALGVTLVLGLATAIPGALLFSAIAAGLTRMRPRAAAAGTVLVWLPWAFPGIILGLGMLDMALSIPGFSMLYGTMVPLIAGLLIRDLPIGVHVMRTAMGQANAEMVEAATIAGAGPVRRFFRIILPMNLPALSLVFLILFSGAIKDIGTILLLAPPGLQTLSLITFRYISISDFEAATVVGTFVALLTLAVALTAHQIGRRLVRVAPT